MASVGQAGGKRKTASFPPECNYMAGARGDPPPRPAPTSAYSPLGNCGTPFTALLCNSPVLE
jgi:hypothetical protein